MTENLKIDFFYGTELNQFLRSLLAITFVIIIDSIYNLLTLKPLFNFFIIIYYIVLGTLIGIVGYSNYESAPSNQEPCRANIAGIYGIIVGLSLSLIRILAESLIEQKSLMVSIMNLTFGIFLGAIVSVLTNRISEDKNLY